ncbi:hypothetical protein AJ87_39070 [Rhizobium yanglingense]|nr:hypothetical protein AJ87_39070 [Rhizobium yanglingense]
MRQVLIYPVVDCRADQIVGRKLCSSARPIRTEQFFAWESELQINTLRSLRPAAPKALCGRDEIGDGLKHLW